MTSSQRRGVEQQYPDLVNVPNGDGPNQRTGVTLRTTFGVAPVQYVD